MPNGAPSLESWPDKSRLHCWAEREERGQNRQHFDRETAAALLNHMPELVDAATFEERQQMVHHLFDAVWLSGGQLVAVTPTDLYVPLIGAIQRVCSCEPGGNRTHDQRIKSPMLYH